MVRVTVKDVSQQDFVVALAAHFKKSGKLRVPEWVDLVKTAKFKELSPYNQDWFYIRCASIIRHLYMRGGVGVKSFQKIYGGRKSRGTKPSHFCRGSSSIARKALQSLEAIKLVTKDEMGGRRITKDGQRDLDRIACQVAERSAKAKLQEAQIQA